MPRRAHGAHRNAASVRPEAPARRGHPTTLFVEPTTRCNFQCAMCVKQSGESTLEEGDLSMPLFERLTDALENLETLILTGMGEPLLHPDLEAMISLAGRHMPASGRIGFQTNGALLDAARARGLVEAGTNRVCVSVDSLSSAVFRSTRSLGELSMVERALSALNQARADLGAHHLEMGIEVVLMKRNFHELPGVIEWAARRGARFVIATHLLPYRESLEDEVIWPPNTDASIELYRSTQEKARRNDVDLRDYFKAKDKSVRTEKEQRVVDLMGDVLSEASRRDIFFHVENLFEEDDSMEAKISSAFKQADEKASSLGLELLLPALRPRFDRRCDFVENGSAFVSWRGRVHPCRFLWHGYSCFQKGRRKPVEPRSFGDVSLQSLNSIWSSQDFVEFREAVMEYDHPYCGNCNMTPCDLIADETFEQDCYGYRVPCGHCPWSEGLLRCLM